MDNFSVGGEVREIKFRAWDKGNKKMIEYVDRLTFGPNRLSPKFSVGNDICEEKNIILMQYTGLKDKNGREIYEGDILGVPNPTMRYEVKFGCFNNKEDFDNIQCGVGFYLEDSMGSSSIQSLQFNENTTLEVIGNIYENPELLK